MIKFKIVHATVQRTSSQYGRSRAQILQKMKKSEKTNGFLQENEKSCKNVGKMFFWLHVIKHIFFQTFFKKNSFFCKKTICFFSHFSFLPAFGPSGRAGNHHHNHIAARPAGPNIANNEKSFKNQWFSCKKMKKL